MKQAEEDRLSSFHQRIAREAANAARDAEEDVDPPPAMTMDEINQREVAWQNRLRIGRGLDDNEGTSGVLKIKDTNKVWEWLRPFDPAESTTEAATGSGASASK